MKSQPYQVISAKCPECESIIRFHEPLQRGQTLTCPECEEMLEVYQLNPLKLDWAFEDDSDDFDKWK